MGGGLLGSWRVVLARVVPPGGRGRRRLRPELEEMALRPSRRLLPPPRSSSLLRLLLLLLPLLLLPLLRFLPPPLLRPRLSHGVEVDELVRHGPRRGGREEGPGEEEERRGEGGGHGEGGGRREEERRRGGEVLCWIVWRDDGGCGRLGGGKWAECFYEGNFGERGAFWSKKKVLFSLFLPAVEQCPPTSSLLLCSSQ